MCSGQKTMDHLCIVCYPACSVVLAGAVQGMDLGGGGWRCSRCLSREVQNVYDEWTASCHESLLRWLATFTLLNCQPNKETAAIFPASLYLHTHIYIHTLICALILLVYFYKDGNGYIDEHELDALLKDLCEKNRQVSEPSVPHYNSLCLQVETNMELKMGDQHSALNSCHEPH